MEHQHHTNVVPDSIVLLTPPIQCIVQLEHIPLQVDFLQLVNVLYVQLEIIAMELGTHSPINVLKEAIVQKEHKIIFYVLLEHIIQIMEHRLAYLVQQEVIVLQGIYIQIFVDLEIIVRLIQEILFLVQLECIPM